MMITKCFNALLFSACLVFAGSFLVTNNAQARSCEDLMYDSGGSYGSSKKAGKRYRQCVENKERYKRSKRTQKDRDRYQKERKKYYPY